MATIRITEQQLKEALSLKLINFEHFIGKLYKYMPASRVIEVIESPEHRLAFVSPEKWYDPYETKYLNTDYSSLNGYKQPRIYCFCARMDNANEEASWKIYKKGDEPLMRLYIDNFKFMFCLDEFARKYDCDIYLSRIDYSLNPNEIDNLYKTSSPYYKDFFSDFNDEKYIKVMSLKRKAFQYENEYRFFIRPKNMKLIKSFLNEDKSILFVPIDINIIKKFTFSPEEKRTNSLAHQLGRVKYRSECQYLSKRILQSYPEAGFAFSNLYSKSQNVEIIET